MTKIAFLGAGNMAAAMVEGLLAQGAVPPANLACLGGAGTTAAALAARTGITACADAAALLDGAGTLVVAFKPQHLAHADPRLAALTAGKLVVSVLAGKHLARLAQVFPHARNLVRAMPNTPGRIGAGISGWCAARPLDPADRATVESLLGALGRHIEVLESQMDAVTALSASGPAFVFEFAAALRDGGVAAGLPRELAQTLAVETVLGSARLLARTQAEPETLRDQVTSPNGTTFAGLKILEARGFRATLQETLLAAKHRAEELAQDA